MSAMDDRAVVLGAGLEGLAAAATLATNGRQVTLVDGAQRAGGVAAAVELAAGYRVPGLLHETALVRRRLLAPLQLEDGALAGGGLAWREEEAELAVPRADGELLRIGRDSLAGGPDSGAHGEWRAFIDRLGPLVTELLDAPPPEPTEPGVRDLWQLGLQALRLRGLGQRDMMELLRVATLPAWDWLEERFVDPALRAGLVAPILGGTVVGPRAAGTTALLLLREATRGGEPVGGLAALAEALEARCDALGVEQRLGVKAASLLVEGTTAPRISGVELADGTRLEAPLVLSTLDPAMTGLDLLPGGLLPRSLEDELASWRTRGSSAVWVLALGSDIGLPGGASRAISASAPEELERAADALKYGELPESTWLDVRDWSREAGCAPAGGRSWSVHLHGVPRELRAGWDEGARAELRGRALAALERLAPGASEAIVAERLLTPADLEAELGLRGGHLHGGELALDQLWLQRPALGLSRYRTPVEGLWLGGAGNHPGGPFHGGAGVLAARAAR